MTAVSSFGSLDELRQAFRAMRTDQPRAQAPAAPAQVRWSPVSGERAVLVCGCGGSFGTTTVALALATVAGRARVVETCGGTASGLAYAASAELGVIDRGWLRGSRDGVLVERRSDAASWPERLPTPAHSDAQLTVVDCSWDIATVLTSAGWLGDLARTVESVVLVARATIPGLRALEASAALVGGDRAIAVTVGANRWPPPVEQSAGAVVRRLRDEGRIVLVPEVRALAISGLTPDPLPVAITRSAEHLLTLLEGRQS